LGFLGVYLPFHISASDFSTAIEAYQSIPVMGYSVTIPHKESAFRFATTSSDLVKKIGAANTLVKTDNGFHAENTDATGIIAAIKNKLGETLDNRDVLILGAGGVSRAAVFALKKAGCSVKVCNRSSERAEKLASEAGVAVMPWSQRHDFKSGLLVNCTSVGMHPNENDSPWDSNCFTKDHVAFDTVYNPIETRFLRDAAQAGAIVIDGVEMFVFQAAAQFNLFTSFNAPLDVMRKTVLEKLRRNKI
jgi:3-dehydroquinate dehydratase/shikimate dehydrogenase